MELTRRDLLKGALAAGSLSLFGIGYAGTLKGIERGWWAGSQPASPLAGNAPEPEFVVDPETGKLRPNPRQYLANTVCVGCTSLCGVRVRVDRETGEVLRVGGNPYHLLSTDPFLPYETSIPDSYRLTSRFAEQGLHYRTTACGRGNAVLDKLTDPYRVLTPLKRAGPRGSGRWQPISFEQMVEEVVEGGDLFGEGEVAGLRAIRDIETPLDPDAPELGPRSNQLAFIAGFKEGRLALAKRFTIFSFGSINFTGHRGNCGLSMRAGYAALLDDWKGYPHLKPDFKNSEFILNIGTAPGNAGNPFKRQGKLVAEGRSSGRLVSVVIDPILTNADSLAAGEQSRWLPIRPGTDGALVMGMIRWILENERYHASFLSQPNSAVAEAAGEASWSNATHLVVVEPESPLAGTFLRASQAGLPSAGEEDAFVVVDPATGAYVAHDLATAAATLFYEGTVDVDGQPLAVKSSLQLLLEESRRQTMAEYAAACGISAADIVALADTFTSYGRRAAADCHGGTMHSNGFYTAYAIVMLNALVGNLNWKGGTTAGGGRYADVAPGPRYNLGGFPGKLKPMGARISRRGFPYEKTSEYRRRQEAGEDPYPAPAPWYPFSAALQSEYLPSALNGYPYRLKALILWNTNPVYGQSGLYQQARAALADPARIPLIIAIDPFINETSAFADYIVPDTVLYETWGSTSAWASHLTKVSSLRWPVVDPPLAQTPAGDPVCMESFLIALAERLQLPGFGEEAIPDAQVEGKFHPLRRPRDWHLRAAANVAFDGEPVPDVSEEEMALTNVTRLEGDLRAVLKADEWQKVAYVYTRGGRFEDGDKAYEGEWLARRYPRALQIYNETLGTTRNSLSGRRFLGTPTWLPPLFADGTPLAAVYPVAEWPLQAVSTKSQLMSPAVVGTLPLHAIHPANFVGLNVEDARRLGIENGDRVRVISPAASVEGIAAVRRGIQQGVVGIEHGYGHWGLGAQRSEIGNEKWHASALRGAGVAINRLGIRDHTRQGDIATLADVVVGANARQGVPVRVEKV